MRLCECFYNNNLGKTSLILAQVIFPSSQLMVEFFSQPLKVDRNRKEGEIPVAIF